ncbi:MAG: hypothetical protein M5U13_15090 [Thermoanaerobaculia bacterium]|nr:hypothetical protein [Thermoanaerobaculia bacterium]
MSWPPTTTPWPRMPIAQTSGACTLAIPPLDRLRALRRERGVVERRLGEGEPAARLDRGDLRPGRHRRERRGVEAGGDEVRDPERAVLHSAGRELGEQAPLLLAGRAPEGLHHEPPLLGARAEGPGGGEVGLPAEHDQGLGGAAGDGGEELGVDLELPGGIPGHERRGQREARGDQGGEDGAGGGGPGRRAAHDPPL